MRKVGFVVAGLLLVLLLGCGGSTKAPIGGNSLTGSVQGRLASNGTRQVQGRFVAKVHGAPNLVAQVGNDGSFRIDGVPAGEQTITVEDAQNMKGAVLVAFVRPGQVTDVGEVKPQPLGKVSGIVAEVDASGNRVKPIAHARVSARPITGEQDTLRDLPGRPFFIAFTNLNGSYELLLPAGNYLVEVSHPDYEPSTDIVMVQALRTVALDFGLLPRQDMGVVFGKVTAVINGQTVPVPGALVALVPKHPQPITGEIPPPPQMTVGQIVSALQKGKGKMHRPDDDDTPGHHDGNRPDVIPPPWRRPFFTFTNADGSYELTGVPAGDYTAIAFKWGFEDQKGITVKANERVQVDFVLQAHFGIVQGKVTDAETGQPIEGALVFATRWGDPWFDWDEWEADDDHPNHWVRPVPVFSRHGKHHDDDDDDDDGDHHSGHGGGVRPMPPTMPIIEPPTRTGTFTDANGNYQLLLPVGEYFISALKEGYEWQGQQVTVTEGQTVIVNFALSKFQLPPDLSSLSVQLKVETPVQLGESVTMTLKVRNNGIRPVTLTFTNPPEADFVVMTGDGAEIWRWSHGKAFIMSGTNTLVVPPPVVLPPGGGKEYEVEWDQKDNDGNPVPAGNYLVQGILNTNPVIQSDVHPLQILPSNQ